jgi:hypothetical protein
MTAPDPSPFPGGTYVQRGCGPTPDELRQARLDTFACAALSAIGFHAFPTFERLALTCWQIAEVMESERARRIAQEKQP